MFDKNILIYSDYCVHSANFANILTQHPDIQAQFTIINIDVDPSTQQRPSVFYDIQYKLNHPITEVPTIIVENGQYILSGEEAFKWLEYTVDNGEKDLEPFNPNEMGSFSDMYADFGSNEMNNAREQSFKFVNKPDVKIQTPQEDSDQSPSGQREQFSNTGYAKHSPKIDFTNKNFTSSHGSSKEKEIDAKLKELMLERNSLVPVSKPPKVDFSK